MNNDISMTSVDPTPSFFVAQDNYFVPQEICRGFWMPDSLHGRALVGLLGRELERLEGGEGRIPARMTFDLHSTVPFAPLRVTTRTLRAGGRLKLAEARLMSGDVEVARATAQLLRVSDQPSAETWSPGPWDAPHPDELMPRDPNFPLAEERFISGTWGSPIPRRTWVREKNLLVAGEALTPWDRLAASADFVSAWLNALPDRIRYINSDITTMINRLPVGEWIGFELVGHEAANGIAVGHCRVHDETGPLGFIGATAMSMKRKT